MSRRFALSPLLPLALLAAPLARADTACPQIADSAERLACFDAAYPSRPPSHVIGSAAANGLEIAPDSDTAVAAPGGTPSAEPAALTGGWKADQEVAEGSGFTNVFSWVDAAEEVQCDGQTHRPSLFLRCMENETAVLLVTDCPVSSQGVGGLVSYQVDDGPTRLRTFIERTDQTALGLWDYGTVLPFLRDITAGNALKMKYTPKGEARQKELNFAISGAAEAIARIDAACGR